MKPGTIVALASGAGRAGVAVIRLSGPHAGATLRALTDRDLPPPRQAARRAFCEPHSGLSLDDGLALWFPGPASFTGEDVAELHVHGGPAVIAAMVEACLSQPGVRPAEPGEFTRRAFENGKLDLAEAEGLADLVEAETEGQRRQALRQRRGGLSARFEAWRARLIEAAALIEAEIDFPDEGLPGGLAARAGPLLEHLAADLANCLDDGHRGERVRDGYRIAIIGPPNVGKSSLLNKLAQREAAIVSALPGTTRDVVEVRLILAGFPVWIADTAGLREAADAIEAEGVRRALERAEEADLRLGLVEAGAEPPAALLAALRPGDVLIRSKSDLHRAPASSSSAERWVSVVTGEGIAEMEQLLAARVAETLGREEAPALSRARHRQRIAEAHGALLRAIAALGYGPELAAEEARLAASAIGRLTGRIDVEELLGEVFASFCIGK